MDIQPHITEFLARFSTVRAAVQDTGGAGLCDFYSGALAAWLRHRGVEARPVWVVLSGLEYPYSVQDPHVPGSDHCVVRYAGGFVDLTARQFDAGAPFPLYFGGLYG